MKVCGRNTTLGLSMAVKVRGILCVFFRGFVFRLELETLEEAPGTAPAGTGAGGLGSGGVGAGARLRPLGLLDDRGVRCVPFEAVAVVLLVLGGVTDEEADGVVVLGVRVASAPVVSADAGLVAAASPTRPLRRFSDRHTPKFTGRRSRH